ncbi:fatty acyl-AMP ligase [soil metagenome]
MKHNTITEVLTDKATVSGNNNLFSFRTAETTKTWSYADLQQQALAVATHLQAVTNSGDRVLILLEPGLNYIAAYMGCLFANCIAIPFFLPRNELDVQYVTKVLSDASCNTLIIATTLTIALPEKINKIYFDQIHVTAANDFKFHKTKSTDIAHIIYTSGTTSAPKGVITTHKNIMEACEAISHLVYREELIKKACSWLPPYHVSGLIGGYLWPLYCNIQTLFFSSLRFIREPLSWLKMIDEFDANITLAPNFAYDLAVKALTKAVDLELDLSRIIVAANGSEAVHAKTINAFLAATQQYGVNRDIFFPCYGLTEATLFMTGHTFEETNKILKVATASLIKDCVSLEPNCKQETTELVSCGPVIPKHKLAIVDIDSLQALPAYHIGEIWVKGPCIAAGYWQKNAETNITFQAQLKNSNEDYLRTGDLGFLDEQGWVYVCGRLKNMLVIRGKNYYAEDIEHAIENAHSAIAVYGTVALGLDKNNEEYLVVIQEIEESVSNYDEIFNAIKTCVMQQNHLAVSEIILIAKNTLARTATGKIKRYLCKEAVIKKQLLMIAAWRSNKIK